jgi:hypothetical protein
VVILKLYVTKLVNRATPPTRPDFPYNLKWMGYSGVFWGLGQMGGLFYVTKLINKATLV